MAGHDGIIKWNGEQDPELELWLGNAFNSWAPSTRGLVVRIGGSLRTLHEGAVIRRNDGMLYLDDPGKPRPAQPGYIVAGGVLEGVQSVRDEFIRLLHQHDNFEVRDQGREPMLEIVGGAFVADEPYILGEPDLDYIVRETNWYDSKSTLVADIPHPVPPIWTEIADEHGEVNSNYGHLVFSTENGAQFQKVGDELTLNPDSRRAVIIYTRPSMHEDATVNGRNDFVCTNTVQYLIREDFGQRTLTAIVQMRSNDAVFGYRNDYAWQRIVQTRLLRCLKKSANLRDLRLGNIIWQVGSLHIYPRHIELLRRAEIEDRWNQSTK